MATNNDPKLLGAGHIAAGNFEPMRTQNFQIQITGLSSDINLSVDNTATPTFSSEEIPIAYGNSVVKFAGKPSFSTIPLVINDYIGLQAVNGLTGWRRRVYDPKTQKIGRAATYKKTCYLTEYATDGTFIRQWIIYGAWLSSLEFGPLSQDGGLRKVSGTITYDWADLV